MKREVFKLYNEINVGQNEICRKCNESNNSKLFSKPISIWKIGEDFKNETNKILFVGKVHRGNIEYEATINDLFKDSTKKGDYLLKNSRWAYWSYTREIIKNIYGSFEKGKEKIAFTNLIKCNKSLTEDKTTEFTKKSCLSDLKVVWREIEILKPTKIIFYTNTDYDNFLLDYKPTEFFKDLTNKQNKKKIGAKFMPWWNRVFFDQNGDVLSEFLRIGHPERLKKDDFVNKVSNWARNSTVNTLNSNV